MFFSVAANLRANVTLNDQVWIDNRIIRLLGIRPLSKGGFVGLCDPNHGPYLLFS